LFVIILILQLVLQFLFGPIMLQLNDDAGIPMFISGFVPILLPVFFRYVLKKDIEGYSVVILSVVSIYTTYMIPYLSGIVYWSIFGGPLAP
jgi:hypothetical protein